MGNALPIALERGVTIIRITNAFDPAERLSTTVEHRPGATVLDYVTNAASESVVAVSGGVVPESEWASRKIREGDTIVICPVPQSGQGGSKSIMRTVAMIAVSVMAPYAGGAIASTFSVAAGSAGAAAITAGVALAGGMLVNAILPVSPLEAGGQFEESPSYGLDGAQNTGVDGIGVPVIYGTYRVAGNRIGTYIENETESDQNLYMLHALSEGPIGGVSEILIEDQVSTVYKDFESKIVYGTEDQLPIPWFRESLTSDLVGASVTEEWTERAIAGEIDGFRVDLVFPQGLISTGSDGELRGVTVEFEIEYRAIGDLTWTKIPNSNSEFTGYSTRYVYTDTYPEQIEEELRADTYVRSTSGVGDSADLPPDLAIYTLVGDAEVQIGHTINEPIYSTETSFRDKTRNPARLSYRSPILEQGEYEVRIRRTNAESAEGTRIDGVQWVDLVSIVSDEVAHIFTACLGVKIKMSDQLTSIPTITALVHGRKIKVRRRQSGTDEPVWTEESSSNPAWIVYDMLTNHRYGGAISESRLDIEKFQEWADHCEEKNLEFNGIFDVQSNVWDSMQYVLKLGHAQLVNVGTRYTLAIERVDEPVMLFNVANIRQSSFSMNWLPYIDRSNDIEVVYFDRANRNKQASVRVTNPDAKLTAPQKVVTIKGIGIDNQEQALREAVFHMNMNRLLMQGCMFEATVEAIAATVGDQILVQHDIPDWGFGGKTAAGSTFETVKLDREVTFEPGWDYTFFVCFDKVRRAYGKITNIVGNYVYLSDYAGDERITRLVTPQADLEALEVFDSSGSYGVRVRDTSELVVGHPYELFQTDVIETAPAVNPAANALAAFTTTEVTVSQALSGVPGRFQTWMLGKNVKDLKSYRITAIKGGGDEYSRQITAVEYLSEIHDLTAEIIPIDYDYEPPFSHATSLVATESIARIGDVWQVFVTLDWAKPAHGSYMGATILASVDGGTEETIGTVRHGITRFTHQASEGQEITYRVVAFDALGASMPRSSAPTLDHVVLGKLAPPDAPTGFQAVATDAGIRLSWVKSTAIDISRYEIRAGEDWEGGDLLGTTDGTVWIYGNQPADTYTFWIKAIDTSGVYSEAAASANVTLIGPAVPIISGLTYKGPDMRLTWRAPESQLPILEYEVRFGDTTDVGTATTAGRIKTTEYQTKVNWGGTRYWFIAAVDAAGQVGPFAMQTAMIKVPLVKSLTAEVIDNNVLLRWVAEQGTLPIDFYRMERGVAPDITEIGRSSTTFTTIFENTSGTFTYNAIPVDTAGNEGGAGVILAVVDEPPNFSLLNRFISDFEGYRDGFITTDLPSLVGPFYVTETYDTHYTSRGWAGDSDAISAGYPIYAQPTPAGTPARYDEVFDTGAAVASCRIITELTSIQHAGSTTVSYGMSTAPANNIADWNDFGPSAMNHSDIAVHTADSGDDIEGVAAADLLTDSSAVTTGVVATDSVSATDETRWTARVDVEKTVSGTNAVGVVLRLIGPGTIHGLALNPITGQFAAIGSPDSYYVNDLGTHWRVTVSVTADGTTTDVAAEFTPAYGLISALGTGSVAATGSATLSRAHLIGPWTTLTPDISAPNQVFATNFRYVRSNIQATNADDLAVFEARKLAVTLRTKIRTDTGSVQVEGTSLGGPTGHRITVPLNMAFVDIISIQLTPQSTASVTAIYDFVDAPYPTEFEIYVFDVNGDPVANPITVSWTAKGY